MNHRVSESELLAWIEGECAPGDAARVEAALAQDAALRRLAESMRRDRAGLRSLDRGVAAPAGLVAEAMARAEREALLNASPVAGRIGSSRRLGAPVAAALAAGLALAVTAVVLWPTIQSNFQGGPGAGGSAAVAPVPQSPVADAQAEPARPVEIASATETSGAGGFASSEFASKASRSGAIETADLRSIEGPKPVSIEAEPPAASARRAEPPATVIDLEAAAALVGSTSRVTIRVRTSDPDAAVRMFEDFAGSDSVVWMDPHGQRLASPVERLHGAFDGARIEPYALKASGEMSLAWLRRVARAAGGANGVESVDFVLAPAAPGDAAHSEPAPLGWRSGRSLTVLIERVASDQP